MHEKTPDSFMEEVPLDKKRQKRCLIREIAPKDSFVWMDDLLSVEKRTSLKRLNLLRNVSPI
jgi:hypothetical protein